MIRIRVFPRSSESVNRFFRHYDILAQQYSLIDHSDSANSQISEKKVWQKISIIRHSGHKGRNTPVTCEVYRNTCRNSDLRHYLFIVQVRAIRRSRYVAWTRQITTRGGFMFRMRSSFVFGIAAMAAIFCGWITASTAEAQTQVILDEQFDGNAVDTSCLLYTSPSPRDGLLSRMPSSA